MNYFKRVIAETILATSLIYSPNVAQNYQDQIIEKIKEEAPERIIDTIVNAAVKKPDLEKLIQENIEQMGISPRYIYHVELSLPEVPLITLSATTEQYVTQRMILPIVCTHRNENEFGLYLTTHDAEIEELKRRNIYAGKLHNPAEVPRLNNTETKIYILHPEEVEIEEQTQKALYLSGKKEGLRPLEESPGKSLFMWVGEKTVVLSLQAAISYSQSLALAAGKTWALDVQKNYDKIKEKYLSQEQKVMNEFAKEINPDYVATKIQLYPARTFGEKEVGRDIVLELKNNSEVKEAPFAVYVHLAFGDYDTGFGELEFLLRGD